MILVTEPKVFLIAGTQIFPNALNEWLGHVGGLEVLDHISGSDAEQLPELCARSCYLSFAPGLNPNVTKIRTDSSAYHKNLLESGHGSVLEHSHATFAFEDVSRVFTHEMVRNRAGLGYSQRSLRYIRLDKLRFWIPPGVGGNSKDEVYKIFVDTVHACEDAQKRLADHFGIDDMKDFTDKKRLTSLFRRIAPMGLATGIAVTFNMRALRWCIEQRTSEAAEIEMRIVFNKVARIAVEQWPMIFQDFSFQEIQDGGISENALTPPVWTPENRKV